MVLRIVHQYDGVYRGVSVPSDYFFEQWRFYSYHRIDGFVGIKTHRYHLVYLIIPTTDKREVLNVLN